MPSLPVPSWLSPTGGVLYHLRAIRSCEREWAPFREEISAWLRPWLQIAAREHGEILIVGPSAGYTLEPGLFKDFKRVIAIEPDPIARLLFAKRHGFTPDWLQIGKLDADLKEWARVLELNPHAAILFSNVLGQLYLRHDFRRAWEEDAPLEWRQKFQSLIASRAFASYHDRLSGPQGPRAERLNQLHSWTSNADLVKNYYDTIPNSRAEALALADHRTEHLFDRNRGSEFKYWVWRLDQRSYHLIEGVSALGL